MKSLTATILCAFLSSAYSQGNYTLFYSPKHFKCHNFVHFHYIQNIRKIIEGPLAITHRALEIAENYYLCTKIVIEFFFRSFTKTKIPFC